MHPYVLAAGRFLLGGLGVLLMYLALFLYQEEEGRLENRLEQWWQRIRRLHGSAISWETAFLRVVLQMTSNGFDRLFGERLFGPKAMAASIQYSIAAILLFYTAYNLVNPPEPPNYWALLVLLVVSGVLIGIAVFYSTTRKEWLNWLRFVFVFMITVDFLRHVFDYNTKFNLPATWNFTLAISVVVLALTSDFLFIALTRATLKWVSQSESFIRISVFAVAIGVVGGAITLIPLACSHPFFQIDLSETTRGVLLLFGASNFLDLIVSIAWVGVALIMLLHRLVWPLVERPIYALYRHRVFTNQRKLLFFTGLVLLGIAVPTVGEILEKLVRAARG